MATVGALVYKIGADLTELKSAVGQVEGQLNRMGNLAATVGRSLVGAFSIAAIVQGARSIMQWADNLDEVSQGIGVNVQQLQKWEYAWKTTGSSVEAGIKAIQTMSEKLSDGSADKAIKNLGLNLETIKRLSPEQQFTAITDALAGVKDQSKFAADGADVFGKAWKSVGISVRNDFKETAAEFTALTESQIKDIGRLQNLQDAFMQRAKSAGARLMLNPQVFLPGGIGATNAYDYYQQLYGDVWTPTAPSAPGMPMTDAMRKGAVTGATREREIDAIERASDALGRKLTDAAEKAASALREMRVSALVDSYRASASMAVANRNMYGAAAQAGAYMTGGLPRGQWSSTYLDTAPLKLAAFPSNLYDPGTVKGKWGAWGTGLAGSLPGLVQSALTGGGGIGGALGAFSSQGISSMFGKDGIFKTGSNLLNTILPGVGSLIGSGASWLVGKLFGPSKEDKANTAATSEIEQLKSSVGSFEQVAKLSKQIGVDLAGAWGSKGQAGLAQFKTLLDQYNAALEKDQQLIAGIAAMQPGQLMSASVRAQIASGTLTDDSRAALGTFITGQTGTLVDTVNAYVSGGGSLAGGAGRGMFNAALAGAGQMRQNGASFADIAATLAPTIGTISGATGISNSFADLLNTANRPEVSALLKSSDQIGDVAVSMDNLGLMNQETFGDLTAGLYDQYSALKDFTQSEGDAQRLMQGSLQQIWEMTESGKLAADANLQAVLDSAEAQGLVGEKFKTSEELLRGSIDKLITRFDALIGTLGGSVPTSSGGGTYAPDRDWTSGTVDGGSGGGSITVVSVLDGREVARSVVRRIPGELATNGVY